MINVYRTSTLLFHKMPSSSSVKIILKINKPLNLGDRIVRLLKLNIRPEPTLLGLAVKALSNSGILPTEYTVGCVLSEVSIISLNDIIKWSLECRRSIAFAAGIEFGQCYLDEFRV
jgi:hypothetical protein